MQNLNFSKFGPNKCLDPIYVWTLSGMCFCSALKALQIDTRLARVNFFRKNFIEGSNLEKWKIPNLCQIIVEILNEFSPKVTCAFD